MKNLQRLALVGLSTLILSLSGCKEYKIEYSEIKHETARVSLQEYVPESTNMSRNVDSEGDVSFSVDTDPTEYNIAFKGKIDFKLDNKEIFDRFKLEDKADVSYTEVYWAVYDKFKDDGIERRKLLERKFLENKFVDAWPIKE